MKRFTETNKWRDAWFRKLKPNQKTAWIYICDTCDHAGVFEFEADVFKFETGAPISEGDIEALGDRVRKLTETKWHIVGFIRFQYGKASRDCKPHTPVFASLDKHGITLDDIASASKGLCKGYAEGIQRVSNTLQDKDKDKDKDKDTDKEGGVGETKPQPPFDQFWAVYPKKAGKADAVKKFKIAVEKAPLATLLAAIDSQSRSDQWTKDGGAFIPNPATWLHQERWADEAVITLKAPLPVVGGDVPVFRAMGRTYTENGPAPQLGDFPTQSIFDQALAGWTKFVEREAARKAAHA